MSTFKYYKNGQWNEVGGNIAGDTLPIGAIIPYGNENPPANWLVCDGSAVSRTTYAELFSAIGTTFGAGDGSTTFNLPNLKGKVPVGQDASDSDFNDIGETGGSKYIQDHYHEYKYGQTAGGDESALAFSSTIGTQPNKAAITNVKGVTTGNAGNLQPYQVVCYIIKAKQSAGLVASVSNTQSDSTTDTYSCDYINNTYSLSVNTPTIDLSQSTVVSNELTIEKSSKSNLFKFYGRLVINGVSNSNGITATIHTGLSGVSANKTYNGFIRFIQQSSTFSPQSGSFTLKQNGDIEISFATANGITRYDFYFQPCTYIIE